MSNGETMTLKEAAKHLKSIGKSYTVNTLKKACDRGTLRYITKTYPITHRVTTMEWLTEWVENEKLHERGRRWNK